MRRIPNENKLIIYFHDSISHILKFVNHEEIFLYF